MLKYSALLALALIAPPSLIYSVSGFHPINKLQNEVNVKVNVNVNIDNNQPTVLPQFNQPKWLKPAEYEVDDAEPISSSDPAPTKLFIADDNNKANDNTPTNTPVNTIPASNTGDRTEVVVNPDGSKTTTIHHGDGSISTKTYRSSSSSFSNDMPSNDNSMSDTMKDWMEKTRKAMADHQAAWNARNKQIHESMSKLFDNFQSKISAIGTENELDEAEAATNNNNNGDKTEVVNNADGSITTTTHHGDGSVTTTISNGSFWSSSSMCPMLQADSEGNHNVEDHMKAWMSRATEHMKQQQQILPPLDLDKVKQDCMEMCNKFREQMEQTLALEDQDSTNFAEVDDAVDADTTTPATDNEVTPSPATPAEEKVTQLFISPSKDSNNVVTPAETPAANTKPAAAESDLIPTKPGDRKEVIKNGDGSTTTIIHHADGSISKMTHSSMSMKHSWSSSTSSPVFTTDSNGNSNMLGSMQSWMDRMKSQFEAHQNAFKLHTLGMHSMFGMPSMFGDDFFGGAGKSGSSHSSSSWSSSSSSSSSKAGDAAPATNEEELD